MRRAVILLGWWFFLHLGGHGSPQAVGSFPDRAACETARVNLEKGAEEFWKAWGYSPGAVRVSKWCHWDGNP